MGLEPNIISKVHILGFTEGGIDLVWPPPVSIPALMFMSGWESVLCEIKWLACLGSVQSANLFDTASNPTVLQIVYRRYSLLGVLLVIVVNSSSEIVRH